MHDTERGTGFATGIVAGALVGAGIALLLAPKSGIDLRGDLGTRLDSARDGLARRLRELADRIGAELDQLQASVERAAGAASSAASSVNETAGSAADRLRQRADEWSSTIPGANS